MPSDQPSRVSLDLYFSADAEMSVDGDGDQIPFLTISSPAVDLVVRPAGDQVVAGDVAAADQLAESAQAYAARLRRLRQSQS